MPSYLPAADPWSDGRRPRQSLHPLEADRVLHRRLFDGESQWGDLRNPLHQTKQTQQRESHVCVSSDHSLLFVGCVCVCMFTKRLESSLATCMGCSNLSSCMILMILAAARLNLPIWELAKSLKCIFFSLYTSALTLLPHNRQLELPVAPIRESLFCLLIADFSEFLQISPLF